MGRIGVESSSTTISSSSSAAAAAAKSELVMEICSISNLPIACSHKHHFNNPVKSHFIDWYLLLGVAEDSGLELVKRRYHKLALQLHPDKNKHPKAEVAFKLVSEAYSCLSDNVKRKAFNSERWKYFCNECNRIPYSNGNSHANSQHSSTSKVQNPANCSRAARVVQGLRDIRDKFKEEIRVIENCLRVNSLYKKESPLFNPSNDLYHGKVKNKSQRETPVFEPSDYEFQGYPHLRSQIYRKSESFWELHRGSVEGRGECHSSMFENASATRGVFRGMFKSKSVRIYS